jgi:peptidyl-prolyl cis-trans isomerase A (cyclophilin A)
MRRNLSSLVAFVALLCGCSSSSDKPATSSEPKKHEPAPALFNVKFETTKGDFTIEIHRDWSPHGVDRFHELVQEKFYDDVAFFRVVRHFVVQFGVSGDPKTSSLWRQLAIVDDPVNERNRRGTITYAKSTIPNSRTTQVFINLQDNRMLDTQGFAPFGKITTGMDVVDQLYAGYGDIPPAGEGPDPFKIEAQGNEYLKSHFDRMDYVKTARVVR